MADFIPAFHHTVGVEGGHNNDPDDRGGETFCGIARRWHPDWPGWKILDSIPDSDKRRMGFGDNPDLDDLIFDFYRDEFWNRLNLDAVNKQVIAGELFDTAVNCDARTAGQIAQMSLNLVGGHSGRPLMVDGICGAKTIQALNSCRYPEALLKCLNGFQFEHYHAIVKNDVTQRKWFRGWLRRVWEDHPE